MLRRCQEKKKMASLLGTTDTGSRRIFTQYRNMSTSAESKDNLGSSGRWVCVARAAGTEGYRLMPGRRPLELKQAAPVGRGGGRTVSRSTGVLGQDTSLVWGPRDGWMVVTLVSRGCRRSTHL